MADRTKYNRITRVLNTRFNPIMIMETIQIKPKKHCVCCGKELLIKMGSQKKCNNCGLYSREQSTKINNMQAQLNKLRKKLYGVKYGNDRFKFLEQENEN